MQYPGSTSSDGEGDTAFFWLRRFSPTFPLPREKDENRSFSDPLISFLAARPREEVREGRVSTIYISKNFRNAINYRNEHG